MALEVCDLYIYVDSIIISYTSSYYKMWLLKLGWITTVVLDHSTKITVDHQGMNSETEQTFQYHIANTTTSRKKP